MKRRTRFIIFLLCLAMGLAFLYPTFQWYFLFDQQDRADASLNQIEMRDEILSKIETALAEFESGEISPLNQDALDKLTSEFKKVLKDYNKNQLKENRVTIKQTYTFAEIKTLLNSIFQRETQVDTFIRVQVLQEFFKKYYENKKEIKSRIIKLGLDLQGGAYAVVRIDYDHPSVQETYPNGITDEIKREVIKKAILTIEKRINRYGISETAIQGAGNNDRIIINLPGVTDITELRQIIETVGVLEFRLVSDEGSRILYELKRSADAAGLSIFDANRKLLPQYLSQLPADTEALFVTSKDEWGQDQDVQSIYVVEKENLIYTTDGRNPITNAYVDRDSLSGQLTVNFALNEEAARRWSIATETNIGRRVAIVLDNVILQQPPTIREKIPTGNTQITLGDVPEQELHNLSLILRSGSLDVPLEISEENTIAASLGRDTIEKGVFAMILACALVFGFMIFWYSAGGFIADIAMILNVTLLLGGLAIFNGTLTLPGIAGIVLTIGMAVDSNVIIYERIKEEFRAGKSFKTAVTLGFDKAFWTILDSNLTTFAAGIGLSFFGTGPIKGFAVTLCLGIICTLFAALFATRLIFDLTTNNFDFKSMRFISTFRGK